MKKILSLVLIAMLSLALLVSLAGCFPGTSNAKSGLERAQEYLDQIMNNKSANTPADYSDLLTNVVIDKVNYPVSWAVTGADGAEIADVKATVGEDGKVTIDVPDRAESEIKYVLVATISDAKGNTLTSSYNRTVPKFKVFTWAEFTSAADDTAVAIDGIITGIVNTDTKHELYLQDTDGGYYVYNLPADEMSDLAIGMEVLVLGNRDTYYGVNQVVDASVEILNATLAPVEPKDITDLYNAATSLKADNLTALQSQLVKIENVVIAGVDPTNDSYYSFTKIDGTNKTYIRISGSACMFGSDDQSAFKSTFKANIGKSATAVGLVSIYNGQIYLIPVTKDAYSNFAVVERDAQGKADWELKQITAPGTITEGGTVSLGTTPLVYTDVTVNWALKSESSFATLSNNKLSIPVLPDEASTITLTVTLTCGEKTATKDFEVTVNAAPTQIADLVANPVAGTAYKFFIKQKNTKQTLYFTGEMDGFYFAATTDPSKAVDVVLELVEGSENEYYFYWVNPSSKSQNYINVALVDGKAQLSSGRKGVDTTKFTYDATAKTLFTVVTEGETTKTLYFGNYNNFTTFSTSETWRITGDNASAVDNTQFVAHFCTLLDVNSKTDAEKVEKEKTELSIKTEFNNVAAVVTLPVSGSVYNKVTISWAVDANDTTGAVVIADGKLTTVPQTQDATVKVIATISHGEVTETKEFTVTVKAKNATPAPTTYPTATELKNGDVVIIVADAYKKALSTVKVATYYNAGIDYADGFDAITDDELFVVTVNADGTYTFTSKTGKVIALAASNSSLNDTGANTSWALEAVSGKTGVFYVKNTVRGNYLEWYNSKGNWSSYNTSNLDAQFEISFLLVEAGSGDPVVPPHEHNFVEGKCECGAEDPNYVPPHEHNFVEGKCECGAEDPNYVPPVEEHTCVDANGDYKCDDTECAKVVLPAADSVLTIPQAKALATAMGNNYTTTKYYITGRIVDISNTFYGNFNLVDEDGNKLYIYGLKNASGEGNFSNLNPQPAVGDELTVYTILGCHQGSAQGKDAWLDELVQHTEHTYAPATCKVASTCTICGKVDGKPLDHTYENGVCTGCGKNEPAQGTTVTSTESFAGLTKNGQYKTITTTSGWTAVNAAVLVGGTTDANPVFKFIGSSEDSIAVTLNGKVGAVGKLTSATLSNGLSQLSFNYGHAFSDSNGVDITINILQNGEVVATTRLDNNSVTQKTAYEFVWELDTVVEGDFVIEIVNNSPSNNSSNNKDRVSIFNFTWVSAPVTEE